MIQPQIRDMVLSRYAVFSPALFDSSNKSCVQIILSTRTGVALVVNLKVSALLKAKDYSKIEPAYLEKMIEAGILVSAETDEFSIIMAENRHVISHDSTLYQCILPSSWCQLDCDYCGQTHNKLRMQRFEQDSLLQKIETTLQYPRYNALHVKWFGAEPLTGLKEIRLLTAKLVEKAAACGCQYQSSMVTNGLALSADVANELVHTLKVGSVEVTLDGPASSHDNRRHTKTGLPTFNKIFDNLISIAQEKTWMT